MSTPAGTFDYRNLRALLAHHQITQKRFAAVCGLSSCFLNRILTGRQPGELARIKIERGLADLGLSTESEARHVAAC
jgi:transcriptional regulator with XRE-family HTH domain